MKTFKRIESFTLALALCFALCSAVLLVEVLAVSDTVASGTCGDNLTWTLDDAGTLTISGSGNMADISRDSTNNYVITAPWVTQIDAITKIIIEDGVTSIGCNAFAECINLTSVSIPSSVVSIKAAAFQRCSNLESIVIPDGVTYIGSLAFNACANLKSVIIPDSVTHIDSQAFLWCPSLLSITIPDSVTFIGNDAFGYCESLQEILVDSNNTGYTSVDGIVFSKDTNKIICYPAGKSETSYTIPENVVSIEQYAFYGCSNLTAIFIPNSVTSIGDSAFSECSNLKNVYYAGTKSEQAEIEIESNGNDSLTEANWIYNYSPTVSIASGTCGDNLIWWLDDVGTLTISGNGEMYDYTVNEVSDGYISTAPWVDYKDTITKAIIEYGATSIGSYAFLGCTNLTSVSISHSVTSIGQDAFAASGLTSVVIPNGVTSIGIAAFDECFSLESVTIPNSVASIEDYAFYYCTSLVSVTIPDSVTSIGTYAFFSCSSLTSVTIPDSVISIGNYAFFGCISLTSVTIPSSVTSIEAGAFSACSSLQEILIDVNNKNYTSVSGIVFSKSKDIIIFYPAGKTATSYTIPDSVTFIGAYAFCGCNNLKQVTISDNITSIGFAAFLDCDSLSSITMSNSVTQIGDYAFEYCDTLKDIYYSGTESDVYKITIGDGNDPITNATWYLM